MHQTSRYWPEVTTVSEQNGNLYNKLLSKVKDTTFLGLNNSFLS